jgi:hypothetical protein
VSSEAKTKIKNHIDLVLAKHQELKDEEAKIIQLLIGKSVRANTLTKEERSDEKALRKRLGEVYESKSENIFSLASFVADMASRNETSKEFDGDMALFFRELR